MNFIICLYLSGNITKTSEFYLYNIYKKRGDFMLYEKLDYVLAIAEEQNLTRAAKKLYISQPTLTMYLNRLEENLGVKLFDRRKTPITHHPCRQTIH